MSAIAAAVATLAVAAWAVAGANGARVAEGHWRDVRTIERELVQTDWKPDPDRFARLLAGCSAAVSAEPGSAYYRYWAAVYRWRAARNTYEPGDERLTTAARAAVGDLNAARALCPTFGPIYSVLGQIEQGYLNEIKAGAHYLELACRLSPNDAPVAYVAGKAAARHGDWDGATARFRYASRLDWEIWPQIVDFYVNDLRRPEKALDWAAGDPTALAALATAVGSDPQYADVRRRAMLLISQAYEDLARQAGPNAGALNLAGAYRAQAGDPVGAAPFFARAFAIDPDNPEVRFNYVSILVALERYDEALSAARQVYSRHPDDGYMKAQVEQLTQLIKSRTTTTTTTTPARP
jgi:tetratricopeptide (TPR) repeat protein